MGRRGFSLVEVMLVALVLSLVGGVFFTVADSGTQIWERSDARLVGVNAAQRTLDLMGEDLRKGSLASLQCPCPVTACPPGERRIQVDVLDITQAPPGNITTVVYRRNATTSNLERVVAGTSQVMVSGLTTFNVVTCDPGGLVTVRLTTEGSRSNAIYGSRPYTVQSRFWVRNR